jgi:hypothetical protein
VCYVVNRRSQKSRRSCSSRPAPGGTLAQYQGGVCTDLVYVHPLAVLRCGRRPLLTSSCMPWAPPWCPGTSGIPICAGGLQGSSTNACMHVCTCTELLSLVRGVCVVCAGRMCLQPGWGCRVCGVSVSELCQPPGCCWPAGVCLSSWGVWFDGWGAGRGGTKHCPLYRPAVYWVCVWGKVVPAGRWVIHIASPLLAAAVV